MISTDVPTVQVVDPGNKDDFLVINRSEFDEKKHKIWTTSAAEKKAAAAEASKEDGDSKKTRAPDPWVLRAHVTDAVASSMEAAAMQTPAAIVAATEDALVNLKMGRQLAMKVKKAASDWLAAEALYKASLEG